MLGRAIGLRDALQDILSLKDSVDVKHPYRLLMVPDYAETPRKPDGGLDWAGITKVIVTEIVDTH
jgi:hypothetical protein